MKLAARLDKGALLLTFLIGLSVKGSYSVLFSAPVSFSLFPLIALGLSVWSLQQRWLSGAVPEGMPSLFVAVILSGVFLYSSIERVAHPEIGSNFVPTVLMVALIFWIGVKIKRCNPL